MTAFLSSSFWYHVHLDTLNHRGGIAVAKEKVAFSSCYLNRVLLGPKFSYLGLPRPAKTGIFFAFQPLIDRYAAPSSLAALAGPIDHDLWCGSSMSPGPTTTARQALKARASQ
ncbi:hypothetical protein QR685DRAFT_442351 [Neurospora intermedia]|uniref:Uncharacterized protein n=1 Tax=Neurospora intermedia TaxID=5142 RepID=A0ABR3DDC5_NEUIN